MNLQIRHNIGHVNIMPFWLGLGQLLSIDLILASKLVDK